MAWNVGLSYVLQLVKVAGGEGSEEKGDKEGEEEETDIDL